MAYVNPGWTNDAEPYINADNLNDISSTLECVPVENGGTGATDESTARTNLGLDTTGLSALVEGSALPISCGGTGGTTASAARSKLGLGSSALLDSTGVVRVLEGTDFMDEFGLSSGDTLTLSDITFSCHVYFYGDESISFSDLPDGFTDTNFHLLTLCSVDKPYYRKIQILFPETGLSIYMRKRHSSLGNWGLITFTTV